MITKILNWFKGEIETPYYVFNLSHCNCIGPIRYSKVAPRLILYYFRLYFIGGQIIEISKEIFLETQEQEIFYSTILNPDPDMSYLRQLLLNNLGHTYVPIYNSIHLKDKIDINLEKKLNNGKETKITRS